MENCTNSLWNPDGSVAQTVIFDHIRLPTCRNTPAWCKSRRVWCREGEGLTEVLSPKGNTCTLGGAAERTARCSADPFLGHRENCFMAGGTLFWHLFQPLQGICSFLQGFIFPFCRRGTCAAAVLENYELLTVTFAVKGPHTKIRCKLRILDVSEFPPNIFNASDILKIGLILGKEKKCFTKIVPS